MLPFVGPAPEPSRFEPINFKKAQAMTRHGSLPKFDFPSLMDNPELLPVVPKLPLATSTSLTKDDDVSQTWSACPI